MENEYQTEVKQKLKSSFREECAKLSKMTFMEKLDYLWTYYKVWLLVLAAVGMLLYVLGTILYNSTFDTVLGVAVINDHSYGNEQIQTWDQRIAEAMELGKKEQVDVEYNLTVDFDGDALDSELSYASGIKVTALVASRAVDVMIVDESALENYEKNSAYMDLKTFLPAELYAELEAAGRIVSYPDEAGNTVPCGIVLDSARLTGEAGIQMEPAYAAVMGNTEHPERVLQFIDYLLGE